MIASATPTEHLSHLRLVLERFKKYVIIVNPTKYKFGVHQLKFLGHLIDVNGVCPLQKKVEVIQRFPLPTTKQQLREFLGLVNFYHRFIPGCDKLLQPLNDLLSTISSAHKDLQWSEQTTKAFQTIKEALANPTLLFHAKFGAPTCIITDASDIAVGAVLQQKIDQHWQPITYFSKKLQPADQKYSTFDHELLSIYLAIKHFHHFVEGRTFHILTDHKPLTYPLPSVSDRHSPRQIRHLGFISQFTTDICYIKGSYNSVADALSRIDINATSLFQLPNIDFKEIAEAQKNDPTLAKYQASDSSSKLESIPIPSSNISIICDISTGVPHPFLPFPFRRNIFNILYLTPEFGQLNASLQLDMSGLTSTETSVHGHKPVYIVNDPKFINTQSHLQPFSSPQTSALTMFILMLCCWSTTHLQSILIFIDHGRLFDTLA